MPLIPVGATPINERISVVAPVFVHPEDDRAAFRMFTAQLICQGACKRSSHSIFVLFVFFVVVLFRLQTSKHFNEFNGGIWRTRKCPLVGGGDQLQRCGTTTKDTNSTKES